MILDEKCKIMIGPFWGQFGPKRAILGTFATFLFLGTSKFEIYMKKQSRIRREMTPLGGVRGGPLCRLAYKTNDMLGSRSR